MSEHLRESSIGNTTLAWCTKCNRMSKHRIDRVAVNSHAGKPGPCLEHGPKAELTKDQLDRRRRQRQKELFP
jgi:hypothetical protein